MKRLFLTALLTLSAIPFVAADLKPTPVTFQDVAIYVLAFALVLGLIAGAIFLVWRIVRSIRNKNNMQNKTPEKKA